MGLIGKLLLPKLLKRAESGDVGTQCYLGQLYWQGKEVPKDCNEALKWFRLAAGQGYAEAQLALSSIYYLGQGVPQDYRESVKWLRLAAEQGNATAQFQLGCAYSLGEGISKDYSQAYALLRLAAARGNADAASMIPEVQSRMDSVELSLGQRAFQEYARSW